LFFADGLMTHHSVMLLVELSRHKEEQREKSNYGDKAELDHNLCY
jgi:hypothetical protein